MYLELNEYQKRLKADANSQKIYQVQLWECKELLVELHQEYYDELLQYRDEFREYCLHYRPDDFIKSKKDTKNKDGQSNERQTEPSPREEDESTPMLPSVLRRDLTQQFGTKAPEKLQRLLCMLRENQDVFQIFTQNVIRFSFDSQSLELAEAIVHFMFLDLASP